MSQTGPRGMLLQDKLTLITGAQQGIGRAIAIAFARAGGHVAVNYLDDAAAAAALVDEIMGLGRKAVAIQADVATVAGAHGLVADAIAALGGLDVLVNNAGVFPRAPFLELTEATYDLTFAINVKGSCFAAQAAARHMVASGRRGAIVNIASVAALGSAKGTHYSATKGAVISLTRGMALELAAHGIRANAIAPGYVDTAQPRYGHSEEELAALAAATLAGRMGTPEEIADAALYLASDMSSFMNGETIQVNGGAAMV